MSWTFEAKSSYPPAPAVAPAKPAKKKASKPRKAGPSVGELIVKAVTASKEKKGMSLAAIKKALAAGGYDVDKNKSRVNIAIKSLVNKGTLSQTKGTGASGSFKVAKAESKAKKPAKKGPAKAKKPAAAKKPKAAGAKKAAAAKKSPKKVKKPAAAKKAPKSPKKAAKSPKKVAKKAPAAKKAAPKKAAKAKAKKADFSPGATRLQCQSEYVHMRGKKYHIVHIAQVCEVGVEVNSEIGATIHCVLDPVVNHNIEEVWRGDASLLDSRGGDKRV
ncbi:uncharacterized protein KZ484_008755 [Pholidichthys leucotaenia]